MTTEMNIKNLIINKVESQEVFDYMIVNSLVNENELYLVQGEDYSVLYTEQSLTEEQKTQARENIGALGANSIPDIEALVYEAIYGFIDGSIENVVNGKATYVRDYAFYKHQSLTSVDFFAATKIGNYSFYQCPSLSTVNIPLAQEIGVFAFKECSSFTLVNFQNATVIGQGCFDECIALSSVNLPLVTTIEPLTFRKCESLITVDLPAATSIGSQAFYSSGITSLTLRSNTVCILESADAFYFTPIEQGTGYIYVPSDLVDSYKTANGWSTYANQIQAIA